MGYWKCSCELYFHPVMQAITKPIHARDGFMVARESIFFKLLSYSANGMKFDCVEQFARYAMMPSKQCQVVWDVCISQNVLRKTESGYTASEWMTENSLLPCVQTPSDCVQNAPKLNETSEASVYTSAPETLQKGAVLTRKKPHSPKVAVRENVYLTDEELRLLQSQFQPEQVSMMLDKLSSFKTEKGWRYRSDFDAINRWVIKWLGQELSKQEIDKASVQKFYETRTQDVDALSWLEGVK